MSYWSEEDRRRFRAARAMVFDMDGTLYRQSLVRRAMLLRLLRYAARSPRRGQRTFRALRAYRAAQERLRALGGPALEQYAVAAAACGLEPNDIVGAVELWMEQEPLDLLTRSRRPGIENLLEAALQADVRLALYSDYPPAAKLEALGLQRFFDVVAYAQQREINAFKPDPRGLQRVLAMLGVEPSEAVYIGDRPEIDAEVARRVGVMSVIVGGARRRQAAYCAAPSFLELRETFVRP